MELVWKFFGVLILINNKAFAVLRHRIRLGAYCTLGTPLGVGACQPAIPFNIAFVLRLGTSYTRNGVCHYTVQ